MILKYLVSSSRNRKLQRWWKFQKNITKKKWTEPDAQKNGPITLFDFSREHDAMDAILVDESAKKGGWRISDDSVLGGFSSAKLHYIATENDYTKYTQGEPLEYDLDNLEEHIMGPPLPEVASVESADEDEEETDQQESKEETVFTPFVRWEGNINTSLPENSTIHRSGFCAIRSPDFPFSGVDLGGRYNGLEIACRSDGRHYSILLKVETMIPDDMFQCTIHIPPTVSPTKEDTLQGRPGPFDNAVFLFQHFFVTSGGRMRATQRDLDTSIKIQSIGITLMDGMDGDFQFDLARIRAVNFDEHGVRGNAD